MEQGSKATTSDELHVELRSTIEDLAKSVDVAVTCIALRAKCSAAIADATEAERAAEELRFAAENSFENAEQLEVSLVPKAKSATSRQEKSTDSPNPLAPMDELYAACNWLATANLTRRPQVGGPDFGRRAPSLCASLNYKIGWVA